MFASTKQTVTHMTAIALLAVAGLSSSALAQHQAHEHDDHSPAKTMDNDHAMPGNMKHTMSGMPMDDEIESEPYPLATCPVSADHKLSDVEEPIIKMYDGREVRFDSPECVEKFEADKKTYFKNIDKAIIQQQLAFYPLTTCVESGESLTEDGEDIAINYVYKNRLVRFCCRDCVRDFKKDPKTALAKLDAAIIAQQMKNYPLKTCLVSGEELGGDMGEPYNFVMQNHLVRFCCKMCKPKLKANPNKYMPALDKAWKEQGMPMATDHVPQMGDMDDMDHDQMDEHDHGMMNNPSHGDHDHDH